ncbi:TlpA family protein disulfide reductase [Tautonia marina]|uniref:TlpA family protein disulfide reductase n=1 Tax=Tautonia marina TaxID=2653855 RepID=UPI001376469A|nr:TlpA disulfide reductase family protein [Tautonia marina]
MSKDSSTAPEMTPDESGAPSATQKLESTQRLRILLMALAVFAGGFVLYREMVGTNAGGGAGAGTTQYAWKVVNPDGAPVDLASYKGRPVLLNVWATWCPPCMMEMPSLIALSKRPELKDADVAVVLVSVDDSLDPVQRFLNRTNIGEAEVLVAASNPPAEFSTSGIPATFLIDPDGRIVRREVGAMDWDTPEIAAELASFGQAR